MLVHTIEGASALEAWLISEALTAEDITAITQAGSWYTVIYTEPIP